MYDNAHLKADILGGVFNGLIFSCCWGFVNGSYFCYQPPITSKAYLSGIFSYTRSSIASLTPLFVLARVTNNYCRDTGYSPEKSGLITFGVTLAAMIVFRNKMKI